jgi:hypothetical protein
MSDRGTGESVKRRMLLLREIASKVSMPRTVAVHRATVKEGRNRKLRLGTLQASAGTWAAEGERHGRGVRPRPGDRLDLVVSSSFAEGRYFAGPA